MIAVYWLWRLAMFVAGHIPPRVSSNTAAAMGNTAYYVMSLRRRIAKENFSHVLGKAPDDPEVRRVARRSFQNYARYLCDVLRYPRVSRAEFEQRVIIEREGRHHLEHALAMGKGAILVSAHFGNMDIPSVVLAEKYRPITLVAESLRPPQLMDLLTRMRAQRDVHMFPYDRAPRRIMEALKRNEMTGFLLDFGITHHLDIATVDVNFFGTTTRFPAGPAQLASITGAPILVGHARVAPDGKIYVRTTEPILVKRTTDRQRDLQVTMQEIATRFEAFIRRDPDQWYMFRPMWNSPIARRKLRALRPLEAFRNSP